MGIGNSNSYLLLSVERRAPRPVQLRAAAAVTSTRHQQAGISPALAASATLPCMDHLWTPWRYAYVTGAEPTSGCIFCNAPKETDQQARIVHRGAHCYIILNTYPYTNGHVMIVPYAHLDELQKLPADAAKEMMVLTQKMETVLRSLYRPDGINLGMNIGKAAGAGVAGHIHMHILPRWVADANFVSVIGETRVLPETLDVTCGRIRKALEAGNL
jgi:ATP adenylyltransferase